MIWEHNTRMSWSCKDVAGLTMNVSKTKSHKWLFIAISSAGKTVSRSQHGHPLEAMNMANNLKDFVDGVKEQKT